MRGGRDGKKKKRANETCNRGAGNTDGETRKKLRGVTVKHGRGCILGWKSDINIEIMWHNSHTQATPPPMYINERSLDRARSTLSV